MMPAVVVSVGTCACYGGIVASGPDPFEGNPTDVVAATSFVRQLSPDKPVINIPGCPAHPDWVAWAVVQLILGNTPPLDGYLRPVGSSATRHRSARHEHPRELSPPSRPARQSRPCLPLRPGFSLPRALGCRGPDTYADCPSAEVEQRRAGPRQLVRGLQRDVHRVRRAGLPRRQFLQLDRAYLNSDQENQS